LRQTIQTFLPNLDLDRVSFHRAMPHLFSWLPHGGITLPHLWRSRRTRIYVARRYWRPASRGGLGLILHEALHAQQVQDCLLGWGWGPLRPFVILYLAAWAGNGFRYVGHPMEVDAYRFAGSAGSRFECWCDSGATSIPWDRLAGPHGEPLDDDELRRLREECSPASASSPGRERSAVVAHRDLAHSIPGWRGLESLLRRSLDLTAWAWLPALPAILVGACTVVLWGLFWGTVTAILWSGIVVVELVGGAVALFLRLLAGLVGKVGALLAG